MQSFVVRKKNTVLALFAISYRAHICGETWGTKRTPRAGGLHHPPPLASSAPFNGALGLERSPKPTSTAPLVRSCLL